MQQDTEDRLLKTSEAAKLLGRSKTYINNLVNKGKLVPVYLICNGYRRFRTVDVLRAKDMASCHINRPTYMKGLCKACFEEQSLKLREQDVVKHKTDPVYVARRHQYRKNERIRRYGVTHEWYEEQLKAGCAICGRKDWSILDGQRHADALPCIDHSHACCPTNKGCARCVRQVLCNRCNRLLGCANDSISTLINAANYLVNHTSKRLANP